MKKFRKRLLRVGLVAAFGLLAFPAQALPASFAHTGQAFGTAVKSSVASSAPSAVAGLGCTAQAGVVSTNTAASINVPGVATTGTINDRVSTSDDGITRSTAGSSVVQNVKLLSNTPVVKADTVTAAGATNWSSATGFTFDNTSSFVNLVVAGTPVSATVAPNTKITLAGIGFVVLNEQFRTVSGLTAIQVLNAIHVVVTQSNFLGLDIGTEVVVGHVVTGLTGPAAARVGGFAYGSYAAVNGVGTTVLSGPSFTAAVPCSSFTSTSTGASVNVSGLLSSGTIVDTAGASLSSSSATATTNSRVQNVSMLGGIITASVVESGAQATSDGTNATYADTGTITNLVVNGNPITVTGGATITVAGVGVLFVHRVIRFGTSIEVRGLDLLVTQPNILGLSVGTNVLVAVARASIL